MARVGREGQADLIICSIPSLGLYSGPEVGIWPDLGQIGSFLGIFIQNWEHFNEIAKAYTFFSFVKFLWKMVNNGDLHWGLMWCRA